MDFILKNESSIPSKKIRRILKLFKLRVRPRLEIIVRDSKKTFYGRYHPDRNHVVIGLGDSSHFPLTVYRETSYVKQGYASGFKLSSQEAALVYLLSHEIRHGWQLENKDKKRRGRVDDLFSESDTEAYALSKLKLWAAKKHESRNKRSRFS
jgi:hypothetical protein